MLPSRTTAASLDADSCSNPQSSSSSAPKNHLLSFPTHQGLCPPTDSGWIVLGDPGFKGSNTPSQLWWAVRAEAHTLTLPSQFCLADQLTLSANIGHLVNNKPWELATRYSSASIRSTWRQLPIFHLRSQPPDLANYQCFLLSILPCHVVAPFSFISYLLHPSTLPKSIPLLTAPIFFCVLGYLSQNSSVLLRKI